MFLFVFFVFFCFRAVVPFNQDPTLEYSKYQCPLCHDPMIFENAEQYKGMLQRRGDGVYMPPCSGPIEEYRLAGCNHSCYHVANHHPGGQSYSYRDCSTGLLQIGPDGRNYSLETREIFLSYTNHNNHHFGFNFTHGVEQGTPKSSPVKESSNSSNTLFVVVLILVVAVLAIVLWWRERTRPIVVEPEDDRIYVV